MKFELGTLLSITDGHMMADMDNIYKILDFMTGESNFTHQLPRVADVCKPVILTQHPELASFDGSNITRENVRSILAEAIKKYGNEFEIEPLASYNHVNPFEELQQMVGDKPIITVVVK
jgi:hypothetical protein